MKIIGHRAQEMTPERREICDLLEVDVFLAADGRLVCRHDHKQDGVRIWDIPSDRVRGPLLDDLLKGDLPLMIELKMPARQPGIVEQVLKVVRPKDIILCFDKDALMEVKRLRPDVPTILNVMDRSLPEHEDIVKFYADGVGCPLEELSHHAGGHSLPLFLWGLENPGQLDPRVIPGIAGIFTDYPERFNDL